MNERTLTLTAVFPADLQWRIVAPDRAIEIGRQSSSEGVPPLAHPTVSRAHLSLRPDPETGLHLARDLGSHNGSACAGEPLSGDREAALRDNSLLQIGDVLLVYEVDDVGDRKSAGAGVDRGQVPGRSVAIAEVRSQLARAAPDSAPVLVIGETGTGKERIARELHRLSNRGGELVIVDCAKLGAKPLDLQLFGDRAHPGAFRDANGGTLMLDEIGELSFELQAELLQVIDERRVQPLGGSSAIPVDVRVIAASTRDLAQLVELGGFLRELYARLTRWELELPPLRERRVDILAWLERLHRRHRDGPIDLSADAASAIVLHSWPENLRGVERLAKTIASRKGRVGHGDLPAWITDKPTIQMALGDKSLP